MRWSGPDRCWDSTGHQHGGVGGGSSADARDRRGASSQLEVEGLGGFRSRAGPAPPLIVDFVRDRGHRDPGSSRWGVTPICAVVTGQGWRIASVDVLRARRWDTTVREVRSEDLLGQIRRVPPTPARRSVPGTCGCTKPQRDSGGSLHPGADLPRRAARAIRGGKSHLPVRPTRVMTSRPPRSL